jgi:hypothetical protein
VSNGVIARTRPEPDDVVVVVVDVVVLVLDDVVVAAVVVEVVADDVVVLLLEVVLPVVVVVVPTLPVHGVPLTAKALGTGLAVVQVPCMPKDVLAPEARAPFQAALMAVTAVPFCVTVEFQADVIICPDG